MLKTLLYLIEVVKQKETQYELITKEIAKRLRLDVCIQELKPNISLNSVNGLNFTIHTHCVLCKARNKFCSLCNLDARQLTVTPVEEFSQLRSGLNL